MRGIECTVTVIPTVIPKPKVMVDAEYRAKTGQGLLRHPAFKGIKRDLMD